MPKIQTNSPQSLLSAGASFGAGLVPGDIVVLHGPLGAGKTTFVQGIAQGLGITAVVTSPSFNIVKEYAAKLCHIDAYRVTNEDVGIDYYIDSHFIICIEWAENIGDYIPYISYEVTIKYTATGREITITEGGQKC